MSARWLVRGAVAAALLLSLAGAPALAAEDPDAARLRERLAAVQADPELARGAGLELLQAQQAVAALEGARRSGRPDALYLAERRVEIAEVMAQVGAARNELSRLELQRSELLLQASRREAEKARREAERLRIQAQIRAEEAERLRLAAEAEAIARSEAEAALGKAAGRQSAQVTAARRKEADLARQEAELVSGKKLPASTFGAQGEVFQLSGAAFASGKSSLTASGKDAAAALAAYLQIGSKRAVRIRAWDSDPKVAQARAAALRDALVAAGVDKGRIKAEGVKDPATSKRSAEVTVAL